MLEKMLALQNKRKKEGGFTLVELIVVLVILAILAALLIPALTGYIDKAKEKGVISETRQCVMAAQTLADELYGKNGSDYTATDTTKGEVKKLADVNGTVVNFTVSEGKVQTLQYRATNGKSCTYSNKEYTIDKAAASNPSTSE